MLCVYRVEHPETGNGPFWCDHKYSNIPYIREKSISRGLDDDEVVECTISGPNVGEVRFFINMRTHPTMWDIPGWKHLTLRHNYKFGCEYASDLLHWFNDDVRMVLSDAGYKVRQYRIWDAKWHDYTYLFDTTMCPPIAYSKNAGPQVIFNPTKAELVGEMDPMDLM